MSEFGVYGIDDICKELLEFRVDMIEYMKCGKIMYIVEI